MNSNYCILTRPEPLCNTEYKEEDKDPKVLSCSLPAVIPTVKPRGWVTELAFPRMNLSLFLVNCLMINYCHSQQTALLFPLNFSGFIDKSWRETGGCISVPLQDCQSYTWCNRSVLHLIFLSTAFQDFFQTPRPYLCSRMPLAWFLYAGSGSEVPLANVAPLARIADVPAVKLHICWYNLSPAAQSTSLPITGH